MSAALRGRVALIVTENVPDDPAISRYLLSNTLEHARKGFGDNHNAAFSLRTAILRGHPDIRYGRSVSSLLSFVTSCSGGRALVRSPRARSRGARRFPRRLRAEKKSSPKKDSLISDDRGTTQGTGGAGCSCCFAPRLRSVTASTKPIPLLRGCRNLPSLRLGGAAVVYGRARGDPRRAPRPREARLDLHHRQYPHVPRARGSAPRDSGSADEERASTATLRPKGTRPAPAREGGAQGWRRNRRLPQQLHNRKGY